MSLAQPFNAPHKPQEQLEKPLLPPQGDKVTLAYDIPRRSGRPESVHSKLREVGMSVHDFI